MRCVVLQATQKQGLVTFPRPRKPNARYFGEGFAVRIFIDAIASDFTNLFQYFYALFVYDGFPLYHADDSRDGLDAWLRFQKIIYGRGQSGCGIP